MLEISDTRVTPWEARRAADRLRRVEVGVQDVDAVMDAASMLEAAATEIQRLVRNRNRLMRNRNNWKRRAMTTGKDVML